MTDRKIPISLPSTGAEEWESLREPLMTGWLTQGPKVAEFERRFAERHGAPHALAATSCTTGLHLVLAAMGVGPGDEVVVPAFTWVSTANVVAYCGAVPVLCDVDPVTFNIDPVAAAARVTPRTKAVIAVHLFGLCADMDALRAALPAGMPIVEDCACAAGATYKGRHAGTLGIAGVFSFHPRKAITTGEGGMITTSDHALADRMRLLSTHGGRRGELFVEFDEAGYNYRLSDINAAIGLAQMDKLESILAQRRALAAAYTEALAGVAGVRPPVTAAGCEHTFQSYVVMLDGHVDRDDVIRRLRADGIETTLGTYALHSEPYFTRTLGIGDDALPHARAAFAQSLTLPLYPGMSTDDVRVVVAALAGVLGAS